MKSFGRLAVLVAAAVILSAAAPNQKLVLHERFREDKGGWKIENKTEELDPKETAIIITDMWDKHWCDSATERVAELAPAINDFVKIARTRGVFIIHAPSETMDFYKDHPARLRAINAPASEKSSCQYFLVLPFCGQQIFGRARGI